jgi:hypothetical protein
MQIAMYARFLLVTQGSPSTLKSTVTGSCPLRIMIKKDSLHARGDDGYEAACIQVGIRFKSQVPYYIIRPALKNVFKNAMAGLTCQNVSKMQFPGGRYCHIWPSKMLFRGS